MNRERAGIGRRALQRPAPPGPASGRQVELEVGPAAHGGHAVARLAEDAGPRRVVFVRHALPGERVRAVVTEGGPEDRYWRADAVEVLTASPDRVAPPCPVAGPGGCGGCDLQHVTLPGQRRWKAAVVRGVLARIGGLGPESMPDVVVEGLPGSDDGLRWRTRTRFAVGVDARPGLRRHRSHDVVPLDDCPVTREDVISTGVLATRWPGAREVAVAAGDGGRVVQVAAASPSARLPPKGWHRPSDVGLVVEGPERETLRRGRSWLTHRVAGVGVPLRVTGHGFWQPHAAAPAAYVSAVREVLAARPGETAADLYAGVGLFAAALAADVGPAGRVVAVESDRRASADALRALHAVPQVRLVRGRVLDALRAAEVPPGAAVVMDPPRAGAGLDVVDALVAVGPRAVAYVACDPAALARDLARFRAHGWVLTSLRAFDAFPMTHHVECVAGLTPPAPGAEPQVRHNVAGRGGSFGRSRAAGAP